MALNTTVRFNATVVDIRGIKANVSSHLFIDDAQTINLSTASLNTWLTDLDKITAGRIIRGNFTVSPSLPAGLKTAPVGDSEVDDVATFDFTQAGLVYHWGSVVPAFSDAMVNAENKPNLNDPNVQAWYNLHTGAILGGYYCGLGNDQLLALSYAFLSDRKHRQQTRAVSLVRV